MTSADYFVDGRLTGTLPDGSSYDVPYYALNATRRPVGAGTLTANREGYHRTFNGIELAATKRLQQRWMGRFGFSWNRAREYFDDPSKSIVDPTPITADPQVNGGIVTVPTAGSSKSQIYLTLPTYQFIANGYYQGPWGVNFGANFVAPPGLQRDVLLERRRAPTIPSTRPRTSSSFPAASATSACRRCKSLDVRAREGLHAAATQHRRSTSTSSTC